MGFTYVHIGFNPYVAIRKTLKAALKTPESGVLFTILPVRCRIGAALEPFSLCDGGRVFFSQMSLKLLTLVWEKAPIKDGALLLLLALADWSDDNGLAWPSVEGLAFKARMGERHARRILREFEADGLVTIEQRGVQHRPNSYRISVDKLKALPERTYCPPCDSEGTSASVQGGSGCPPEGVRVAPDPSGTVIEPSSPPIDPSGDKFVEWFLELLKRTNSPEPKITASIRAGWIDAFDKLQRIDGKSKADIWKACEWARNDPFWSGNFRAPPKLRERRDGVLRIDLFLDRIAHPQNGHSQTQRPNSRSLGGNSSIADFEEYERRLAAGV